MEWCEIESHTELVFSSFCMSRVWLTSPYISYLLIYHGVVSILTFKLLHSVGVNIRYWLSMSHRSTVWSAPPSLPPPLPHPKQIINPCNKQATQHLTQHCTNTARDMCLVLGMKDIMANTDEYWLTNKEWYISIYTIDSVPMWTCIHKWWFPQ